MGLSTSRVSTPPQEDGSSSGESVNGRGASDSGREETVFTWCGGQTVFVTGSWDHWEKKTALIRDPATGVHSVGLTLPLDVDMDMDMNVNSNITSKEYSYKFFVDGNWQCNPSQPTRTDDRGNTNNYLTVHKDLPDTPGTTYTADTADTSDTADTTDTSTPEPYHSLLPTLVSPSQSAMAGDVPVLPRLLAPTRNVRKTNSIAPHIFVDRLFCSKGDPDVKTLSLQSRYQAKIITTVYVTPA